MRVRYMLFILIMFAGCATLVVGRMGKLAAQTPAPARGAAAPTPTPAPARGAAASAPAAATRVHGNLAQVMRGILFPNSNIIFASQDKNPADIKPDTDSSASTDPLSSVYGGWQAVENAGLALAESANLLTVPGRLCLNGKPVPVQRADWTRFVQGLRDAGMASYKAAQAKNQDQILDAADKMTVACSNCHDVYRDKKGGDTAGRCVP